MSGAFTTAVRAVAAFAIVGLSFFLVKDPFVGKAAAQGVGVFPTDINLPDTLRGGEYLRDLGLINGTDSERVFTFEVKGPLAAWVSFVDVKDRTKTLDSLT